MTETTDHFLGKDPQHPRPTLDNQIVMKACLKQMLVFFIGSASGDVKKLVKCYPNVCESSL